MKSYFYKSLFLIFLFSLNSSFAQYTFKDSALIRTTFLREFNKKVIFKYLSSDNPQNVNAALLSVSHSEDTTFIDSIIKLDFSKYSKNIFFALGQLGESKKSSRYLFEKLKSNKTIFNSNIYSAIGLCGDSSSLEDLFELLDSNKIKSISNFPLAISNFHFRGINSNKSIPIFLKYLNNSLNNLSAKDRKTLELNIFYSLFRLGSSKSAIPILTKYANSDCDFQTKLYVLANFRKLEYFPNNFELLKKLGNSKRWEIRTELANAACFYNFKNKNEVEFYLSLINDKNPNVSRTAAIASKNINFSKNRMWFKDKLEILLDNENLTANTKGELFVSFALLFNSNAEDLIDKYDEIVEQKFIYRMLSSNKSDWEFNYDYLIDRIPESSEVELLDLLPAFLSLQSKYLNNKEYAQYLFTVMQSNMPSSVSIIADGLSLPVVRNYYKVLQELILEQIFRNKNNPQFAETTLSLAKLSLKINRPFYDSIIDMLATSKLYSLKKYALSIQGEKFALKKGSKIFNSLWNYAFIYKNAIIKTNKGNFTIKLKPEFAPITSANFSALANMGFYNGVTFHRVVPNFVIQTGDTSNTGWGGANYEISSEFSPLPFSKGAVGIASVGKDTEGSQWFVMHSLFTHLNGRYTNWAEVIEGIDVVDTIDEGDRIISVELIK